MVRLKDGTGKVVGEAKNLEIEKIVVFFNGGILKVCKVHFFSLHTKKETSSSKPISLSESNFVNFREQ